ncbi:MAG: hypothetical protein B5M48_03180 [Candidatus Omnitrophica bacterium 4484_213]|nr:MAG: hypothetical protein B5M48_03180 [Candidatus Omnitrophica bacterium 4484_213]
MEVKRTKHLFLCFTPLGLKTALKSRKNLPTPRLRQAGKPRSKNTSTRLTKWFMSYAVLPELFSLTSFILKMMMKAKKCQLSSYSLMAEIRRCFNPMRYALCAMLLILILTPAICFASEQGSIDKLPLEVSASVDKDKATIGDKITYSITVKADKDIEIKFPEFGQNLGGFAIKDFGTSRKGWFRTKTYRQWYVLDTYTSGKYSIPEARVKYRKKSQKEWQEVSTDEITVEVESILENAEDKRDIREIAGPIGFPVKIPWYLWGILGLIALGAGTAFFLFKRKKTQTVLPPRPAHEIAYEALEALTQKEYLRRGELKLYYIELSDIVRHYLENRFNLRAPEMTTEEFLNSVKDNKALSYEHKSLLRDFLSHCDLVKFARYKPPEKEVGLSFESAKKLIDQTKEEMPKVS